jgi:hypothetical protein
VSDLSEGRSIVPDWKAEIRRRLQISQLAPTREATIVEELAQYLDDCYAELLAGGATKSEAHRQTLTELRSSELLGLCCKNRRLLSMMVDCPDPESHSEVCSRLKPISSSASL